MAGQKRLSIAEKELIKSWVKTGSSNKKIALRLNRGQSTIRRFTAALRLMNNPSSPSSPSPNFPTSPASPTSPLGRPPNVTEVAKRSLKKFIMANPRASAAECKIVDQDNLKDISIRTIQATLKDKLGIPSRRAAKKPLLTLRMKKMRLMFAKKYKHWISSDWRNVMYSDESSFKTIRSSSVKVRRPLGADRGTQWRQSSGQTPSWYGDASVETKVAEAYSSCPQRLPWMERSIRRFWRITSCPACKCMKVPTSCRMEHPVTKASLWWDF